MCRPDKVKCFGCFEWFDKNETDVEKCESCGDFSCPRCGSCLCSLTKREQKIVLSMIYTYEKFIEENFELEEKYDFSQHDKIKRKTEEI